MLARGRQALLSKPDLVMSRHPSPTTPSSAARTPPRRTLLSAPRSALPIQWTALPAELYALNAGTAAGLQSCIGLPLGKEEQASLLLSLPSVCASEAASADTSVLEQRLLVFLGGDKDRPPQLQLVEGALLLLEQLSALRDGDQPGEQGPTMQLERAGVGSGARPARHTLDGRWQLVFTTAGGWPRLQYIPVPEFLDIHPEATTFSIDTQLGPVHTSFLGRCAWRSSDTFWYHVERLQVRVESLACGTRVPFPQNELRIFSRNDAVACARSRGGGMLLMKKG